MSPQITVPPEDLPALVTLVGLVVRVGQQVGLQVGPLVEAPLTDGTLVGGLLHVENLVDRQGPRLTKSLAAI